MLLTLAISRGVPMILAGDEFRRTQLGNNNAYCQDNETSWVDWSLLQRNRDIFQFARGVLALRRAHPVLRQEAYYVDKELQWFDPKGESPDWFDPRRKALACLVRGLDSPDLYLMFNADSNGIRFVLPAPRSGRWRLAADTTRPTPRNFYAPGAAVLLRNPSGYLVAASAAVILEAG
jgi:isoamylase